MMVRAGVGLVILLTGASALLSVPDASAQRGAPPEAAVAQVPPAAEQALRRRYAEMMTEAARRARLDVDVGRLEYASTRDGVIVIVPTHAAIARSSTDGTATMLVWASLRSDGARPLSQFFAVERGAPGSARARTPGRPTLPPSLAAEIARRMNGTAPGDNRRMTFRFRFLPSFPDTLELMDATDPCPNFPC